MNGKLMANFLNNRKKLLSPISPIISKIIKISTLTSSIQHCTRDFGQCNKQEEIIGIQLIRKR